MKKLTFILFFFLISFFTKSQDIFAKKYEEQTIYNFISEWVKTPYRFGGQTKKGIDCSALTLKFFKEIYNLNIPRTASQQYKASEKIKKSQLETGDLVFFRNNSRTSWHVGVYLNEGWFFHSTPKKGVTFANINDGYYERVFYGGGRLNDKTKI